MSAQNYAYEYWYDWSMTTKSGNYMNMLLIPTIDEQALKDEVAGKMNSQAEATFLEKMSQSGHWYNVDAVRTDVNSIQKQIITYGGGVTGRVYNLQVTISGRTHIKFTTDIADPTQPSSPALVLILAEIATALAAFLVAHPWVLAGILVLVIFFIGSSQLLDVAGRLIKDFGKVFGDLSGVVAIAIIVVVGVLGYSFLSGGGLDLFKGRRKRKRK